MIIWLKSALLNNRYLPSPFNKKSVMKKFPVLFFILTTLLVLSCTKSTSNDNDPDPNSNTPVDKSANLLTTGDSASDILGNANFNNIIVEAAYVEGYRPTAASMDAFVAFLHKRTFKENISIEYRQLASPDEETLTLQEIADLEAENRTIYNDGTTLSIYIYFADAPSDDDDEESDLVTLGAVYRNTSMVIYESVIKQFSTKSSFITDADIESATLNHEFGHLFGLVNLGTTPVNDHEDPEAENHCNVIGCLMRAELQFGGSTSKNTNTSNKSDNTIKASCALNARSVLKILEYNKTSGKGAAVDLDAECILDLQSNGGR